MIANVSAHRRANAFAQALEERSRQDTAAEQSDEPAEQVERTRMLALASGLAAVPKPELDPEVKTVQRAQLMAAMEAMARGAAGETADPTVPEQRSRGARGSHRARPLRRLRPRTRLSKGLAAGGLTVSVAAGAFGGVAAASSDALPGDSLYGLKRGMEDVKLGLAHDDADRGEIYLDQASTRLSEARRLMERDRSGPLDHESVAEVRRTLSGMRHDASEAHRLLFAAYERDGSIGPIQALTSFSDSHRVSWSTLRNRLPVQLGDVGDQVSSVFDAIQQEVDPLRSLLPQPPAESPDSQPNPGQHSPGAAHGTGGPTPSASGSSAEGRTGDEGSPKPSDSRLDGLLGGDPSDLLGPPDLGGAGPSPSGKADSPPQPEVTLPPLLPGFLPGLGFDSTDGTGT